MSSILLKNFLKRFKLNESTISMVLGALVVIVVGGLVINYFRNSKPTESTTTVSESPVAVKLELPTTYKVVKDDTLWKIAELYYGSGYNWVDIAQANSLSSPNLITADQELTIPKVGSKLAQVPIQTDETVSQTGESITGDSYTVVKGDCLWKIAVRAYGDGYQWVKIAHENNLVHPNLIHPGNVLTLPR